MEFTFVFPGQGSQSLGMMNGLKHLPHVMEVFAEAHDVLGVDFMAMLDESTTDTINQTINTQPLMLTAGYATFVAWQKVSARLPHMLAGHSLGEWTALVAGKVLSFQDALRLVKLRAELMQNAVAVGVGSMAAVLGLDDETVGLVCDEISSKLGLVIAPVNFNSPGQVVIAGHKQAIEVAIIELKERGARKVQLLAVSVPSHCKLMVPASEELAKALANVEFSSPHIPILHNYNVESYTDGAQIKDALVKQLYSPVLWSQTIKSMVSAGIPTIVECGPGKILTGLNKRIDHDIVGYNLANDSDLHNLLTAILL